LKKPQFPVVKAVPGILYKYIKDMINGQENIGGENAVKGQRLWSTMK
jgi:hypothetical protein